MRRIMFVCHGNICRSPMAEFILKDMVKKAGLSDTFIIASCATSTEEIFMGKGNPVYPPARRELEKHGIDCNGKTAVQLKKEDYDKYDMFLCMDENNRRNALRILGSDPQGKVSKLMDHTSKKGNVDDPWYSGDFTTAYNDIFSGCKAILEKLC